MLAKTWEGKMADKDLRTAQELVAQIRAAADPDLEYLGTITILRQKGETGWVPSYAGSTIPPDVLKRAEDEVIKLQAKYDLS